MLAIGCLFLLFANDLLAVTAREDTLRYTQPDGSRLTLLLHGDEFCHWASTADGYTVLSNALGTYEYATADENGRLSFSGRQAHNPDLRSDAESGWLLSVSKGLRFSRQQVDEVRARMTASAGSDAPLTGGFPTLGTRKLLMILANFSNTATTYDQATFNNFMNQPNFNGTGSFRDYYLEVSYGQLTVNTTVTVWVNLPGTHDFYGPQSNWGQFAFDAITAATQQTGINLAEFDNNLDGTVDGIAILHQGQGQEETGNVNDIWSHSWNLSAAGFTAAQRTFGSVSVDAYTTIPERNATGTGTIGVMCHEFGHSLGSPDFYDTDYGTNGAYVGTGKWDLMAGGSWNGVSGTKPAHPNAWVKAFFNWTVPQQISSIQSITLRDARLYPDVVRYNTLTPNEYFLCENRQQTGFDAGLPGHGLIIYHVDGNYIASQMASNAINAGPHQGLYPVCALAGGLPPLNYGVINGPGCPFPGSGNKSLFTDLTLPNARSWGGTLTGTPVTNIFEYGPLQEITFCFISCNTPSDPTGFTATPSSTSQIDLSWSLNTAGNPVMVAYGTTPAFGNPADSTIYPAGTALPGGGTVIYSGTAASFAHTGLNTSTTYYYKAWSVLPGNTYSTGVTARGTTFCGAISAYPWNEGFENGGAAPGCWTQEQVGNSGISWTFTVGNGNINPATAHAGAWNALLKDKTTADNRTKLVTPQLDLTPLTNPELTFWHTQAAWGSDQDKLNIYYRTSATGTWTLLASYTTSIAAWTRESISLTGANSTYYIAFEGNAKFGYGICLDDIQVANGCTNFTPVNVSIAVSMNPVFQGTVVTTEAMIQNGGTAPSYQWKIAGTSVNGATNASFSIIPANNDEISCVVTSNASCTVNNPAISNSVIMEVASLPLSSTLQNIEMTGSACFDATQEIVTAGSGTGFTVHEGGNVTLIAGTRISMLPGTTILPGGYLHGYITTNGQYCGNQVPASPPSAGTADPGNSASGTPALLVYPNPTTGDFTLGPEPGALTGTSRKISLFTADGTCIRTARISAAESCKLSLEGQPAGIYLLRTDHEGNAGTVRIVKVNP